MAVREVARRLVGREVGALFGDMGAAWDFLLADPQLRWCVTSPPLRRACRRSCRIGPEKGVIHIATGAVSNALWDLFARARGKPLWKLLVDFTPVRRRAASTPSCAYSPPPHRSLRRSSCVLRRSGTSLTSSRATRPWRCSSDKKQIRGSGRPECARLGKRRL